MNCVHLIIFQHDTPCLAGIFSTRLRVSIPLIVLILSSFNTDSSVDERALVCRCLQSAWSESKLYWLKDKLLHLMGNSIGLTYWTRLHIAQHNYSCSWTRLIFSVIAENAKFSVFFFSLQKLKKIKVSYSNFKVYHTFDI